MQGGEIMKEQIKEFIVHNFMFGEGPLNDDHQLFESGIIDSLGLIKLLSFMNEKLGISVDMSDVTMEKFATVNDIMKTIEKKFNV